MDQISMVMQDIEVAGQPLYALQHHGMKGNVFSHIWVEPERLPAGRHQFRQCAGVLACEQGHLMTLADELVGKVGDDAFGPAVEPRRHAFNQRRNLRNLHERSPYAYLAPSRGAAQESVRLKGCASRS